MLQMESDSEGFLDKFIYMDQHNQDNHCCKFCDFRTPANEDLRSHLSAKHKEYKCSICQEKFFNLEEIRLHIREEHLTRWTCQICDKSFANETQYKSHCNIHLGINSEEICHEISVEKSQKAIFDESGESLAATSIHKSQKHLKCLFCDFSSADNDTLNVHLRCHVTIEILQCRECGVCFDHKEQLEKHKIAHKKVYYQCGVCDTKSQSKKFIIKHPFDEIG
ncbi:hypothetical protein J437_LFUL010872 [Ladona fulva]|uniref:C2H2-type domain-containing protein n=1 Tax=Ladona fulva TaxID=123851 RepID=A0A8K0K9C0_LADFU|nr:hypothetical protein J437_LFUL010872 [Ladona fulva]